MKNVLQFNNQNLLFKGQRLTFQSTTTTQNSSFGFPPQVVASIESRFGSVKRYLRLRLLGQI